MQWQLLLVTPRWVLKWLAYPIQHPGAKMRTALVLHGPQGTGKNMFFEAIMAKNPDLRYDPDDGEEEMPLYDFFKVGVHESKETGRRRYLSEDWFFCQLAAEAGYELYADTNVVLKHCGDAIFPLQKIDQDQEVQP